MGRDNPHRENAFDRRTVALIYERLLPIPDDKRFARLAERVK